MLIGRPTSGLCTLSQTASCSMVSNILMKSNRSILTIAVAPRLGLPVDQSALNSVTRGLVGDSSFAVLPDISPETTFVLTLFFQIVSVSNSALNISSSLCPVVMLDQALPPTNVGDICWRNDSVRVRILLIRLARP